MRVSLTSSGGFAAALAMGRPPLVVDTAALPATDAEELASLLATVAQETPAEDDGRARDAVTSTVTVTDAGTTTVLRRSEAASSPAWEALLSWVRQHAAARA